MRELRRGATGALWEGWPKLLGLGVFALSLWAQPNALVGVFYDDGLYVVLAKALAEGEGFRFIHLPEPLPGVHYPFLYPVVLSVLWRVWPTFPQNVVLFQLFDAAALGAAAWLVALHARRWDAPRAHQYVALPLGFAAFPLLTIVGVRFSEPLFLALAAGCLLLADRDDLTPRTAVLAGALAGMAALARSIGVVLVIGAAAALWARGRRREAALAAGTGAAVAAPWLLWVAVQGTAVDPRLAPNYSSYLAAARQSGAGGLLAGVDSGVAGLLARLLLPGLPGWLWYPLAVLLVVAVAWGAVCVVRRVPALVATLALYAGAIALWPYIPDRFAWVLMPWLMLLGVIGGADAWRRARPWRALATVLLIAVALGYPRREAISIGTRGFAATAEGISQPFRLLVPAIAQETPADAVLAGEDEALLYLYTGRRSVPSFLFRQQGRRQVALSVDSTTAFFCESGVTHLATTGGQTRAAPMIDALSQGSDPALVPQFVVTDGPALYRFQCPG